MRVDEFHDTVEISDGQTGSAAASLAFELLFPTSVLSIVRINKLA
jgi:hypothetical protein